MQFFPFTRGCASVSFLLSVCPAVRHVLGRQKLYTVGGAYRSWRGWYKIFHENGPAQGLPQALTGKNQDGGLINSDTQDLVYISKRERKSEIIHENCPKPGNSLI